MKRHHKKNKETRTRKVLEVTLVHMAMEEAENYTGKEIIRQMIRHASENDLEAKGVIPKCPSTFSRNRTYRNMILSAKTKAKVKRINESLDWESPAELNKHELKLALDLAMKKNELLANEVSNKDKILEEVNREFFYGGVSSKTLVLEKSENNTIDGKFKILLKEAYELLVESGAGFISRENSGQPYSLYVELPEGLKKIVSQDILDEVEVNMENGGDDYVSR